MGLSGFGFVIGDFIASIPHFFYLAYTGVGNVVFYELLSGNLMAKPANPHPIFTDHPEVVEPEILTTEFVANPEEQTKNDEFNF